MFSERGRPKLAGSYRTLESLPDKTTRVSCQSLRLFQDFRRLGNSRKMLLVTAVTLGLVLLFRLQAPSRPVKEIDAE